MLLALAFGQLHGFSFASALAASMGSLRTHTSDWLSNLAGFNLGIEVLVVILLVPALVWIVRHRWSDTVFKTLSFIVMSARVSWFFSRI